MASPTAEPTYTQFACIGTGFSGIGLGATLKRWYNIDDVRFFERNSKLGGTWFANQYPGCACDIPSALYSFSFESNPNWSRVLPPHDELWRYLDRVAQKYSLTNKMTFNANVERCEWVEDRQRWRLIIRRSRDDNDSDNNTDNGDFFTHECQFLFAATGQLMQPRPLDIPGAETFQGPLFHSSRWDNTVDLTNKRVVVFGNGCTASQLIPSIVHQTQNLTQIVRTKHWILPSVDSTNTAFMKAIFRRIPGTLTLQRFLLFIWAENALRGFYTTAAGTRYRRRVQAHAESYMRATAPAKYHEKLIPTTTTTTTTTKTPLPHLDEQQLGCKRRIFDSAGYLRSLHADNLTLLDEPVREIVPRGIRMQHGGRVVYADVIVVANGFVTNSPLGGLSVVGRAGKTIQQHWDDVGGGPGAYNCTVMSGFPNFFCLLGPNSLTGHTSAVIAAENCINFALRIIRPLLDGKGTVVEVKREAEQKQVAQLQRDMHQTVWFTGCRSWYLRGASRDGRTKWNASTYPYSQAYFWYRCLFPKFDDLVISGLTHPEPTTRSWRKPAAMLAVLGALSVSLGISRNPKAAKHYWQRLRLIAQLLRIMVAMKLSQAARRIRRK